MTPFGTKPIGKVRGLLQCIVVLSIFVVLLLLVITSGNWPFLQKLGENTNASKVKTCNDATCKFLDSVAGNLTGPQLVAFSDVENLEPNDTRLLEYIRKNHLHRPSGKPYNLSNDKDPSEFKAILNVLLKDKVHGIFLEAGANDGEFLSNTLALEKRGWTGVLIEANPNMVSKLLSRNRKAFIFDVGISPSLRPQKIEFLEMHGSAKWEKGAGKLQPRQEAEVPLYFSPHSFFSAGAVECFPLSSILASVEINVIDYFSLDVEGYELKILKTINYDELTIKVIQVEHNLVPEGKIAIKNFLESKGYLKVFETFSDYIFIKKSYIREKREKDQISI